MGKTVAYNFATMERRFGSDRRKHARGGRRPTDQSGYSPLIMVIEPDAEKREVTEAILARLRFAVVPVDSVERALSITRALRPSVIVCSEGDAPHVHAGLQGADVPVVTIAGEPDVLLENIRRAIRARVIPING